MAIKTPDWAKRAGAYPTSRGWAVARPKGREEIIRSGKFTAAEIAEWHGQSAPAPVVEEPVMQTLHEAPAVERVVTEEEVEWHAEETEEEEPAPTRRKLW